MTIAKLTLSARRVALRVLRKPGTGGELRRMHNSGIDRLEAVAAAIAAVINRDLEPGDRAWFERLEAMRARTNARTDVIGWRSFQPGEGDEIRSILVPRTVGGVGERTRGGQARDQQYGRGKAASQAHPSHHGSQGHGSERVHAAVENRCCGHPPNG